MFFPLIKFIYGPLGWFPVAVNWRTPFFNEHFQLFPFRFSSNVKWLNKETLKTKAHRCVIWSVCNMLPSRWVESVKSPSWCVYRSVLRLLLCWLVLLWTHRFPTVGLHQYDLVPVSQYPLLSILRGNHVCFHLCWINVWKFASFKSKLVGGHISLISLGTCLKSAWWEAPEWFINKPEQPKSQVSPGYGGSVASEKRLCFCLLTL